MKDLMLDTETLGREPGCAILSIGAVLFDPRANPLDPTQYLISSVFYRTIDLTSQLMKGFYINPETLEWWRQQEKAAQEALSKATDTIDVALAAFCAFCQQMQIERVWCQGANFDAPIVQKAIEVLGYQVPWKFYNVRDTRTVYDMCDFDYKSVAREGTYHNALADAQHQVKCIQYAMRNINK